MKTSLGEPAARGRSRGVLSAAAARAGAAEGPITAVRVTAAMGRRRGQDSGQPHRHVGGAHLLMGDQDRRAFGHPLREEMSMTKLVHVPQSKDTD